MTGRYVHHIGAWDNSTPIPTDAVTWAHRLRAVGYDVVLSGKQHFYGPDQLHGFRAQLARDLHAERHHPIFDWSEGIQEAPQPWGALEAAGPGTTEEIEVDDQVEAAALDYLRDPARQRQPWALNVSFMAPHFPFVVPQRFWDLYSEAERWTCRRSHQVTSTISIRSTGAYAACSAWRITPRSWSAGAASATTA